MTARRRRAQRRIRWAATYACPAARRQRSRMFDRNGPMRMFAPLPPRDWRYAR